MGKDMNIWDCEKKPLTELLSNIVDNRGKTVPTVDSGRILIATNCITNKTLFPLYERIRFISDETYFSWFRGHPIPGDILFVNKGTPGRVCLVPDPVDFSIAQDMIALRADESIVYSRFLFAILRSERIQKQIYNISVGDVIPHFKKQFLDQLLIPLPERRIQEFIGDMYYNLSLKVEHNRRIIQKLEEQAQALFKSWFVDFDPFQDKTFVDSEMGMIPEGWRVGTLDELCDIVGGGTPSKSRSDYFCKEGIPWLTPKDLSVSKAKFTARGEIDITELGYKKSGAKLMPKGSVLYSSRAPIGYISIAKNDICTNQGFKSAVPGKAGTAFLYYYLKTNTEGIIAKSTGSTFKEASGSLMKSLSTVIPPKDVLSSFEELEQPLFKEQEVLEDESRQLAIIRDTLLPKLIYGEIAI